MLGTDFLLAVPEWLKKLINKTSRLSDHNLADKNENNSLNKLMNNFQILNEKIFILTKLTLIQLCIKINRWERGAQEISLHQIIKP